jgi:glycosyltransferase involved in cell wall biosynthesis
MKILYVTDFSIEGDSGKNKATREKGNALAELIGRDNVEFIYPKSGKSFYQKTLGKILFDIHVTLKVLGSKDELVIVQRAVFLPFLRLITRIKRIKIYAEYHADFKEEIKFLNKSWSEKSFLYIVSYFYTLNYRLVDGIIFNHPILKDKFDNVFRKPSIFSYNGSNSKDFYPISTELARSAVEIPSDSFTFLFLGSVSKWHGVEMLIDAFNEAKIAQLKNVFLYVVGIKESEYTNKLKSRSLNGNVVFINAVDTKTAANYINSADFCVLPVNNVRTSPGSPLKLYDYIACGKPVITQEKLLGYADEVERYSLGFTTNFYAPEIVANDLIKFMELDLSSFAYNNRMVATQMVSWRVRMAEWLKFIDDNR